MMTTGRNVVWGFARLMCCFLVFAGLQQLVCAGERGIRGSVVDEKGEAVSGVVVRGFAGGAAPDFPSIGEVTTGADGKFEFSGLKEVFNYLGIRDSRYAAVLAMVMVEKGEPKEVKFVMRAGKEVRLKVVDPQGNALAGAKLAMLSTNDPVNGNGFVREAAFETLGWPELISDEEGMLSLGVLPEDVRLDLWVTHEKYTRGELKNVAVADAVEKGVQMRDGPQVEFRLHPSADMGKSLENERVAVRFYAEKFYLLDQPEFVHGNAISVRVVPGAYRRLDLLGDGVAVTPMYTDRQKLRVEAEQKLVMDFLVRPTVTLKGRVIDEVTGKPIVGADVGWRCENLGLDGKLAFEDTKDAWAVLGWVETDEKGEYEIKAPKGKCDLMFYSAGYMTRKTRMEFEVTAESQQAPEIRALRPPVISGMVLDGDGKPVRDCIVRFGNISHLIPTKTDSEGRFQLKMKNLPWDPVKEESASSLRIVAFDPHRPLDGIIEMPVESAFDAKDVKVVLKEGEPGNFLRHHQDRDNDWEEGNVTEETKPYVVPEGQVGQTPPALDALTWLNLGGESATLETFRGKYVFLDFSATWCGPCREDLPTLKMVHELYGNDVVMVYIHDNSVAQKEIKEFVEKEGVDWPVAIDHPDGRILKEYQKIGVRGYPSYMMLDREGKIIKNDHAIPGPTLRTFKLEVIRKMLWEEKSRESVSR